MAYTHTILCCKCCENKELYLLVEHVFALCQHHGSKHMSFQSCDFKRVPRQTISLDKIF
jgi:hypothetical protein